MSWLSQVIGAITGGNHQTPSPVSFANGSPVPKGNPASGSGSPLPVATPGSSGSQFTSAQQAQIQSALDAAGIWGTVKNVGGDVWDVVSKLLPHTKDAAGNDTGIDWGKLGSDIVGWVKNNKDTILQGLAAYNAYSRQQQSDKYAKQALDLATQSYNERAPLRTAGMAGMLNPGANTPDLSKLASQGQQPLQVAAPTTAPKTNMQNAQSIAGAGSGNPFAPKTGALPVASPTPTMPSMPTTPTTPRMPGLPIAPTTPSPFGRPSTNPVGPTTPPIPTPGVGGYTGPIGVGSAPINPGSMPINPAAGSGKIANGPQNRAPLPVASPSSTSPSSLPTMPATYLQNGQTYGANGQPSSGYNALTDLYRQLGTTPGSVNPQVAALVKQNPGLIDSLPPDQAATLRRSLASTGA